MDRHLHVHLACLAVFLPILTQAARAEDKTMARPGGDAALGKPDDRPDLVVSRVPASNPVTAPYSIKAEWKKGAVVLSGRVGTSVVHDIAIRTVLDLGFSVKDDLIIDTAEAHRVAL